MGTATILIVDNEPKDRRLLEVLLEPEGYITVSAADGRGALAAVAEHSIDLILLDVMMPGMSGYEVADVLKADPLTSSIPIIMVSARIDHESRLAGLESGVDEFLTKPVDRTELWLRVRSLLRGKKYADQLAGHSAELEQKIAEASADLHRFRMAMDATVDAIILADRTTMKFVEVNGTASRMLGYSREELLALTPGDLYAASDDVLEAGFDAVIAGDSAATQATVQLRRKDGSYFPAEVHTHAHLSGDDWIIVAVLHDVTEREEANKRLQHLAHNDSLTGLPNRALFHKTLEQATALASNRRWTMAVMFLDLDQFKNINDTLGHAFGDALLVQVAQRLLQCVRLRDTVGRLGGDEFGLIVSMESGHDDAAQVAGKVREALRAPFIVAGEELQVTASIGISMHPQDSSEVETLIKYADTAMYRAKQAGRDTFRFFTPQMNAELITRLSLESALREAVEKQQFVLHYQPKVQISSGRIVGVEALLRWDRPGHGLIPPNDFIPALESTGLITEVGGWVIDESCRQIAEWSASTVGPMKVAVNVSGRQVLDGDVNARVGAALAAHGVAGGMLELELTESSLMEDTSNTIATLNDLKAQGVQLSIDDFGTGYSCLEYLRRFPIDKLKIDIAFVRHVIENPDDAAIVRTIIQMAHSLKLEVVAEGVETRDQLGYLAWQGCDQIQGYLVSRPLPAGDLNTLLTQGSGILVPAPSTTEASSPMPSRVLARQG